MKVSIVTVVLNNQHHIANAIESVLNQTYPNIEYIIVDGESTDGTLDIIAGYGNRIAKVVSEKDKGLYYAMNKGLKLSTGDIIGVLNSDDFYVSNTLVEDVVNLMQQTGADTLYGDLQYVDKENTNKVVRYWKSGKYRRASFKFGWMPPHPTFFVRRSIYLQYGYFDTDLRSAADYELMLRFLYKYGVSSVYLPKLMIKMRTGGKSNVTLANRLKANSEDRNAWIKNGLNYRFYTRVLKPVRKIGQFFNKG